MPPSSAATHDASIPLDLSQAALHRRYARRIDRVVAHLIGGDPERADLVQESLMRVFKDVGRVRDTACLDHWVAKVTMNTVLGALRRRKRDRCMSLEDLPPLEEPSHLADPEVRDLATRAIGVIRRLPDRDRDLLVRYWLRPESLREVAVSLGCSTITVKRKLRRARARFERLVQTDHALSAALPRAPLRRRGSAVP